VPEWADESGSVDCAAGDLDGDGEDEYLVRVTDPVETLPGRPSASVLIFDRSTAGYEVAFQTGPWDQPVILGVRDFNGDGKVEASFTVADYGSNTFWTFVSILAWDGQQYADLFPQVEGSLGMPNPRDIRFVDVEGDGIEELYLAQGPIGSIGAGPTKDTNATYAWDGISYVLVEHEYEPSDWLYLTVMDADDAYTAGNWERSLELYDKAINDPSLRDWKAEYGEDPQSGSYELLPYAYFRLYLTQLYQGQEASLPPDADPSAQDLVDSIAALLLREFKLSMHAQAAYHFAEAYPDGELSLEALSQGCAAFLAFVEEHRQEFDAVWDYGWANPELVPERLCPH